MSTRRPADAVGDTADAAVPDPSLPTAATPSVQSDAPADEAALQERIETTREQLGETVAALAAKTDVKARSEAAAAQAKDRVVGWLRRAWAVTDAKVTGVTATVRQRATPAAKATGERARAAAATARNRRAPLAGAVVALGALSAVVARRSRH